MRKSESARSRVHRSKIVPLILGALLALGIALIVILLGSFAVSLGILKQDAAIQTTAGACLVGCFFGGKLACSGWETRRLFAGLLTGGLCFLLILTTALCMDGPAGMGTQALIECAACLLGGGIAGGLSAGKTKKRRKNR